MLAEEIGSWHLDVSINGVVSALLSLFQTLTGKRLRNKVEVYRLESSSSAHVLHIMRIIGHLFFMLWDLYELVC